MPVEEQRPKDVGQMTAEECLDELGGEENLQRLRPLVALRRVMAEIEDDAITGTLEALVQKGYVKKWRYHRSVDAD